MGAHATIEAVFRAKYGELCSSLLGAFGYANFDRIEEALQTAFERALQRWPDAGVPANPAGWLYAVARNNYLEGVRHAAVVRRKATEVRERYAIGEPRDAEAEIVAALPDGLDDFAEMILLCCNPDLSEKAHLCLMLKAGCGLSVHEIGRLLDMGEEAVKKMLTRSKARIARDATSFEALDRRRISGRFPIVIETVYALFTEGYAASSGELALRRDVASQALHLCDVLLGSTLTPKDALGDLQALAALMLLQLARFDARVGSDGVPVRLQEQDRSRWNAAMIRAGLDALDAARASGALSPYHLEARIAAEHSTSLAFEQTNWTRILELYDQLLLLKDTSAVRLNRVVAVRYVHGPLQALVELDALAERSSAPAATSFLRHTVRADVQEALGRTKEARRSWQAALAAAPTGPDRIFVERRADLFNVDVPQAHPRASS